MKRARTFCAQHKSLAACTDLLPLARLFWAKSMFTPLPQFPRPCEPRCLHLPAAAGVKFCCVAHPPGGSEWAIALLPAIVTASLNALPPAPPARVPLGNKTLPFSTKYPPCQGSVLPIGGEICRKNRKKNSGLGFVKEACFLWGKTGRNLSNQGRATATERAGGLFRRAA